MEVLSGVFLYLAGAVIAVPIAQRFGLGSVLGYLIAGVVLSPVIDYMLGAKDAEELLHFSEFGVVMMLFLIGLELRPNELWNMRRELLGLGAAQVGVTVLLIAAVGPAIFGLTLKASVAVGMILALSSTAIVLQTLQERGLERTRGGRAAFSVLLFQDIVVILMIAAMPFLAGGAGIDPGHVKSSAEGVPEAVPWLRRLPDWLRALATIGVIASIILAGRFLAYPFFHFIASGKSREVFTAAALALVIGTAALVSFVGLSPALGAFLAGVVLSGSEYRHQLESDIEPFKGLLLGVFFISVGAGVNFTLLAEKPLLVLGCAVGVILLKGIVLAILARLFRFSPRNFWLFTLSLPQAGEFGFVLLGLAAIIGAVAPATAGLLTLVIAVTMFLTPLLFILFERVVEPRLEKETVRRDPDVIEHHGPVVIAGVGRFGQIVNRMLRTHGIETVVLDSDPRQLDTLRKFGVKAYYGDASRTDLLEAAGIGKASVFIATLANSDVQVNMVRAVRERWPNVHVVARASDRQNAYQLKAAGAHTVIRELLGSSLDAGRETLKVLGMHPFRAERLSRAFRRHDEETFDELEQIWTGSLTENEDYINRVRARSAQLETIMSTDRMEEAEPYERGWHAPDRSRD